MLLAVAGHMNRKISWPRDRFDANLRLTCAVFTAGLLLQGLMNLPCHTSNGVASSREEGIPEPRIASLLFLSFQRPDLCLLLLLLHSFPYSISTPRPHYSILSDALPMLLTLYHYHPYHCRRSAALLWLFSLVDCSLPRAGFGSQAAGPPPLVSHPARSSAPRWHCFTEESLARDLPITHKILRNADNTQIPSLLFQQQISTLPSDTIHRVNSFQS